MEELYYSLDNDLTFQDNIRGSISVLNFTTRTDYSTASPVTDGFEVQKLSNPIPVKPEIVCIGQVINQDTFAIVTDPVSLSWSYADGEVKINYINGLADETKYQIKLLII